MTKTLSATGGARIGSMNATWPFARLSADPTQLSLRVLGRYEFTQDQVVALEPIGRTALLSNGVRIVHNRHDYPEKVIFWCMGKPETTLRAIAEAGFVPRGQVSATPRPEGWPLSWPFIIAVGLVWNLLFFIDIARAGGMKPGPIGPYSFLAVALAFCTTFALQHLPRVRALALRTGHQYSEIKSQVLLIQVILGFLMVVHLVLRFA